MVTLLLLLPHKCSAIVTSMYIIFTIFGEDTTFFSLLPFTEYDKIQLGEETVFKGLFTIVF